MVDLVDLIPEDKSQRVFIAVANTQFVVPFVVGWMLLDYLVQIAHDHPECLSIDIVGEGERALIRAVNGAQNEGRFGNNWIIVVDDLVVELGVGQVRPEPGRRYRLSWMPWVRATLFGQQAA